MDCGPGSKIGVVWKIRVTYVVPKTEVQDVGDRMDNYSQNYHFGLVYVVIYQFLGMEAKNYKLNWYVLPTMPSICGPRWCRYSTKKCLPDSHVPFVYVVMSISPFWRIGETNPSTKTSKILFSIVMPTFGKSCQRFWLHGLKKQS